MHVSLELGGLHGSIDGTQVVTAAHGPPESLRHPPGFEQVAADHRMVESESLGFLLNQGRMRPRRRENLRIAFRFGLFQHQHAYVLQQGGKEKAPGLAAVQLFGEHPRGNSGGQRPAPIRLFVDAAAVIGRLQRKTQRQGDGGIESKQADRLAQVVDLAPGRVQRRIGRLQQTRAEYGIVGHHAGHFAKPGVGILPQFQYAHGNRRQGRQRYRFAEQLVNRDSRRIAGHSYPIKRSHNHDAQYARRIRDVS